MLQVAPSSVAAMEAMAVRIGEATRRGRGRHTDLEKNSLLDGFNLQRSCNAGAMLANIGRVDYFFTAPLHYLRETCKDLNL